MGTKFTSSVSTGFETTDRAWIVKPRSDNVVLDASRLSESNHWGDGNSFVHPLGFVESW